MSTAIQRNWFSKLEIGDWFFLGFLNVPGDWGKIPCVKLSNKRARALPSGRFFKVEDNPLVETMARRWFVTVHFSNGDHLKTSINGTRAEIRAHYLDGNFSDSAENPIRAVEVVFHN